MKAFRICALLGMGLGTSACVSQDVASRNDYLGASAFDIAAQPMAHANSAPAFSLANVEVIVPRDLAVSEAYQFDPKADIIWRGDRPGDRHAQVQSLFVDAFAEAAKDLKPGPRLRVSARVIRFQGLTEKMRYTVGGTYNLQYELTIRQAATGQLMAQPYLVETNIQALGGGAALDEEKAGRSQRMIVIEALQSAILAELAQLGPDASPEKIPLTAKRLMEKSPLPF